MGYGDTYVSGVTNTLLRQGDAAAQARLRRGDIAAQTLGQLGQIASQVPGQIQQAQQEQRAKAELQEAATLANQLKMPDGQPDWGKVADALESKSPMSQVAAEIRRRAQAQQKLAIDTEAANSDRLIKETNLGLAQNADQRAADQARAASEAAAASAAKEAAIKAILTKHVDPTRGVIVDWSPAIDELAAQGFTAEAKQFADLAKARQPEKVTFGAPTAAMVGGKRVFFRTGSDGKTYDMSGNVVAQEPTPIPPQAPQPSYQWATDSQGNDRLMTPDEIRTTGARRPGAMSDSSMPAPYRNALGRALLSVTAQRRTAATQLANRLWQEGNENELKGLIQQAAIEGENVDVKNQVLGRQATMASLQDTKNILNELKDKGVPTNWFTGSVEDLYRKLGKTSNPEYVALGNRLAGTLINYRRAATGVAFGEKEGAAYAKMFPNYKNELPVNIALIEGLEREMRTYDKVYWEHKLGTDGAEIIIGKSNKTSGGDTPDFIWDAKAGKLVPNPKKGGG